MPLSATNLKEMVFKLGFNLIGIVRATPSPTLAQYQRWLANGMHADMHFMARPDRVIRRENLAHILPGVQSLVIVGLDYTTGSIPDEVLQDPARGRIAAYAWGVDYHDIMTPRLEQLATWLQTEANGQIGQRVYVDTGAILERSHAQQAGMGFIGKNTMLIHPRRGSHFFLGEMLLTAEFDTYDEPHRETMCGTCTRCLTACPTDAFPQPHVLDARRCISYHTIENKGWLPRDLARQFGNWIFGCDICQEVCPFQRFAPVTQEKALFPPNIDRAVPPLKKILEMNEAAFMAHFAGSPVQRIKRDRLVRNACVAAGNSYQPQFIPALKALLQDASPIIRGHAARALWDIARLDATGWLKDLYHREPINQVRAEVEALLS